MALTINEQKGDDMSKVTVDRRLWLTSDGETLVEDGDPQASFLWAVAGRQVTSDEADRVGYKPDRRKATEPSHVCDVCGKEAATKAGLAAHKRSHNED